MKREEILYAMNQLDQLMNVIHRAIQDQANREAASALANYPHGTSDPQLTRVKDQLVEKAIMVNEQVAELHKKLVGLNVIGPN